MEFAKYNIIYDLPEENINVPIPDLLEQFTALYPTTFSTPTNGYEWDIPDILTVSVGSASYESFEDILKKSGVLDTQVRITSGYRDYNIGKSGSKSNHRKKDEHGNSMAYDLVSLVPGKSVKEIFNSNPIIHKYLLSRNARYIDERTKEALHKTGGTGPHEHFSMNPNSLEGVAYAEKGTKLPTYAKYQATEIPEIAQVPESIDYTEWLPLLGFSYDLLAPLALKTASIPWAIHSYLTLEKSISNPSKDTSLFKSSNKLFNTIYDKVAASDASLKDKKLFFDRMARLETGGTYDYTVSNKDTHATGWFLLTPSNIRAYGNNMSIGAFANNPEALIKAALLLYNDFERLIGDDYFSKAEAMGYTKYQVMAGAWLAGAKGVKEFLDKGKNNKDSNGTSIALRMKNFKF